MYTSRTTFMIFRIKFEHRSFVKEKEEKNGERHAKRARPGEATNVLARDARQVEQEAHSQPEQRACGNGWVWERAQTKDTTGATRDTGRLSSPLPVALWERVSRFGYALSMLILHNIFTQRVRGYIYTSRLWKYGVFALYERWGQIWRRLRRLRELLAVRYLCAFADT